MANRKRYRLDRVVVASMGSQRGAWKWGRKSVSGAEHLYEVVDKNYERLNHWEFVVQEPKTHQDVLIVRPLRAPGKRSWAGIDRRSISFQRTNRNPHRGKVYCKISFADPLGEKTKLVATKYDRQSLPNWMNLLRYRIRLKKAVARTRGGDENHLVILARPEDYATMIRVFFATKVWVLDEEYIF